MTPMLIELKIETPIHHSIPSLLSLVGFHFFHGQPDRDINELPFHRDEHGLWHCSFPLAKDLKRLEGHYTHVGRFEPQHLGAQWPVIELNQVGKFPKWSPKKAAEYGSVMNAYKVFSCSSLFYSAKVTNLALLKELLSRVHHVGKRHQTGGGKVVGINYYEGRGGSMVSPDGTALTAIPVSLAKHYPGLRQDNIKAHHAWQLPHWDANNHEVCYVPPIFKSYTEEELACL